MTLLQSLTKQEIVKIKKTLNRYEGNTKVPEALIIETFSGHFTAASQRTGTNVFKIADWMGKPSTQWSNFQK